MRFTAVARVTDWSWTALAFHDSLGFGMLPMQQLVLEDTICNEIRQHRQSVIFGHASADAVYSTHRVPGLYGFESYLSIPIITPEGAFFGTLCALDREPKVFSADFILQVESEARWIGTQVGGLLGKPDQR
ncbi:GAF domain-containing protein [Pseudoxanthomonas composti]|uniref:GAF domain-containing protein n=2 Tax=Pseudoxanthomonas composti TaxID=2137479 RepID=A0A4Q1JT68_9GAMM|nr:GAF domain-containing protein [Pseudoxanthomonas composti]